MVQVLRREHALDQELVDHGVPQADVEEAEYPVRPGIGLVGQRLDHGQAVVVSLLDDFRRQLVDGFRPLPALRRVALEHRAEALDDAAAVAERLQAEHGHREAADDHHQDGQHVHPGDRFQAAPDGPDASHQPDQGDREPQAERRAFRHAESAVEIHQRLQREAAAVDHRRQEGEDVGQDSDHREGNPHLRVEAFLQEFRRREDPGRQQEGNEQPDHEGEGDHRAPLAGRHGDAVDEGRADQADEVLGGNVGGDVRRTHHVPGQRAAGQEVVGRILLGRALHAARGEVADHAQRCEVDAEGEPVGQSQRDGFVQIVVLVLLDDRAALIINHIYFE